MAESFKNSSCPLLGLQMGPGRECEGGGRGREGTGKRGSDGEVPWAQVERVAPRKEGALLSAEGQGLGIFVGHIKGRCLPDAGQGRAH